MRTRPPIPLTNSPSPVAEEVMAYSLPAQSYNLCMPTAFEYLAARDRATITPYITPSENSQIGPMSDSDFLIALDQRWGIQCEKIHLAAHEDTHGMDGSEAVDVDQFWSRVLQHPSVVVVERQIGAPRDHTIAFAGAIEGWPVRLDPMNGLAAGLKQDYRAALLLISLDVADSQRSIQNRSSDSMMRLEGGTVFYRVLSSAESIQRWENRNFTSSHDILPPEWAKTFYDKGITDPSAFSLLGKEGRLTPFARESFLRLAPKHRLGEVWPVRELRKVSQLEGVFAWRSPHEAYDFANCGMNTIGILFGVFEGAETGAEVPETNGVLATVTNVLHTLSPSDFQSRYLVPSG